METSEKKKPGRPRKKADAQTLIIHGICEAPSTTDILNEFACGDTEIVRKTISLQKTCNVNDVEFFFDVDSCRISSIDQSGKIELVTTFDCTAVHRYYCSKPIAVRVTRTHLDKVIDNLTKGHDLVSFILKEDFRRSIYCVMSNTVRKSVATYTIPTAQNGDPKLIEQPTEGYPLSFCLPSKELKTKMTNLKLISPLLVIQKVGQGPMQLTCESNKDVDWDEVFHEASPINMECSLKDDEVIRVTVFADLVKSFVHHVIGATTLIKVDQTNKLILTSHVCQGPKVVVTSTALIDQGSKPATTA